MPRLDAVYCEPLAWVMSKFLYLLGFWIFGWSAQAQVLGELQAFEQVIAPNVEQCLNVWRKENDISYSCVVQASAASPSFLLQSNINIHNWRYDSGQGWRAHFWLFKSPDGFTIKADVGARTPPERLTPPIVGKYIRSLLADWGQIQYKQRVMRAGTSLQLPNEIYLGPVMLAQRTVNLTAPQLSDLCFKNLRGDKYDVCVLHFASYAEGQISLEEKFHRAEVVAPDQRSRMRLTLGAKPAWQGQGAFGLAYLRVELSTQVNARTFNSLFAAAVKKLGINQYSFKMHKIGAQPTPSDLFVEKIIGPIQLQRWTWQYNESECKKNWTVESFRAFCKIPLFQGGLTLSNNQRLIDTLAKDKSGVVSVVVERVSDGYQISTFGYDRIIGNFEKVRHYIRIALDQEENDQFESYTIVLPQ